MVLDILIHFSNLNFALTCPIVLNKMKERFGVNITVKRLHRIFSHLRKYFKSDTALGLSLECNSDHCYYIKSQHPNGNGRVYDSWADYLKLNKGRVNITTGKYDTYPSSFGSELDRLIPKDAVPGYKSDIERLVVSDKRFYKVKPLTILDFGDDALIDEDNEGDDAKESHPYFGLIGIKFQIIDPDVNPEVYQFVASSLGVRPEKNEILIAMHGDIKRISKVSRDMITPVLGISMKTPNDMIALNNWLSDIHNS